jgi:drug/metabolite transporter (DMT)-like permease
MQKENVKAYAAWIAICIIWGTTYLAIRIGVGHLPPMLFAGLRWLIAGSTLLIYFKIKKQKLPRGKDLLNLAVVGLALIGFGNGLVVTAEKFVPSGITALFLTTLPFWMVGGEAISGLGKKLNSKTIIGLLFGLSGAILIFSHDIKNIFNSSYIIGMLCLTGSVICWSFGSIYSKYKKVDVPLFVGSAVQMFIAGIAQTSLGLILGEAAKFHFNYESFLAFSYLLIMGSLIGYGSYIYAIAHLPLSLVSTYAYINPIIALFLGWLILDEKITITIGVAAVIIFLGVIIVREGTKVVKKPR